jgi:predicted transposase YbfD/YdcC
LPVKRRYFISSLKSDAKRLLLAVRTHWEIENKVHWVLDIAFREDDCRIRKGNSAENLAVLRQIALNLRLSSSPWYNLWRKQAWR